MSDLTITIGEPGSGKQPMKPNTYWFHIFQAMVEHELANLGPDAFAVYCVIKSHCNLHTGVSIPSIETIARKAGISSRHVMRQIRKLEDEGYVSKSRPRKHNEYRLTEKIVIADGKGRRHGYAEWRYRPLQIENTVKELKSRLLDIQTAARSIHIEKVQIIQSQTNIGVQITQAELDELAVSNRYLYTKLLAIRDAIQKRGGSEPEE